MSMKYLKQIQNIVRRMSESSFRVKLLSLVTLVASWGLLNRVDYHNYIFVGMCILVSEQLLSALCTNVSEHL